MSRYRQWRLRRRLHRRARELAGEWHHLWYGQLDVDQKRVERLIYTTLCHDHAVKP